jgi:hypothetical protein
MLFSTTSHSPYLSTSCFYLYPSAVRTVRCPSFFPFLQTLLHFTFTGVKCYVSLLLFPGITISARIMVFWVMIQVSSDVTMRLWWEVPDDWMERRTFRRVWRPLIDFSTTHLRLAPTLNMYGAITLLPLYASTPLTHTTLTCTSKLQPKKCNVSWLIYFYKRSTCFRRFLRPSTGAYNYTYSFRYCQTILLLDATVEGMELLHGNI